MGKSMPAPPPPPDPHEVAKAQTGTNVGTAIANSILGNANEVTPWGTVTYNQIGSERIGIPGGLDANGNPTGGGGGQAGGGGQQGGRQEFYDIPRWERNVQLSPDQQHLFDQTNLLGSQLADLAIKQTGRLHDHLGNPITADGLPGPGKLPDGGPQFQQFGAGPQFSNVNLQQSLGDVGGPQRDVNLAYAPTQFGDAGQIQREVGPADFSQDRLRVEEALRARVNPELDRYRDQLETRLVNQGHVRGTGGFNASMDEALRRENDMQLAITAQGGTEQARMFDQLLRQGQFVNTAQQQDYLQQQGRGLFELGAINQNNEAALAGGKFVNEAQQQAFGQDAFARNFANDAQMQQAGFNNQMSQLEYDNLMQQIQGNNTIAQQQFGNQLNLASAVDTQRERQLQELLTLRNQPINEISALMSGAQVGIPQFSAYKGGNVADTPVGDYIYKSADIERQNWMAQMQQKNAAMSGMFSLGGSLLGAIPFFSDRRLKRDIRDTGIRLLNGLKVYAFRYLDDARQCIGLMADEVIQLKPEAVSVHGGFLAVNYGLASEAA